MGLLTDSREITSYKKTLNKIDSIFNAEYNAKKRIAEIESEMNVINSILNNEMNELYEWAIDYKEKVARIQNDLCYFIEYVDEVRLNLENLKYEVEILLNKSEESE